LDDSEKMRCEPEKSKVAIVLPDYQSSQTSLPFHPSTLRMLSYEVANRIINRQWQKRPARVATLVCVLLLLSARGKAKKGLPAARLTGRLGVG
jgi:hypothetical protein